MILERRNRHDDMNDGALGAEKMEAEMALYGADTIDLAKHGAPGWSVKVEHDEYPTSPREWDNLGAWASAPDRDEREGLRTVEPEAAPENGKGYDAAVADMLHEAYRRSMGDDVDAVYGPRCECMRLGLDECYADPAEAFAMREAAEHARLDGAPDADAVIEWAGLEPRDMPHGFARGQHVNGRWSLDRSDALEFAARCARVLLGAVVVVDEDKGGWWYVSADRIDVEVGRGEACSDADCFGHGDARALKLLEAERETYAAWAEGRVYAVTLEHDGETGYWVGGFYLSGDAEADEREAIVQAFDQDGDFDALDEATARAAVARSLGWQRADAIAAEVETIRARREVEAHEAEAAREARILEGLARINFYPVPEVLRAILAAIAEADEVTA